MEETRKRLMLVFWGLLVLEAALVTTSELSETQQGWLVGSTQTEFMWTTLMELLTLACAYLALRLFRFNKVKDELVRLKATALKRWALLRLAILGVPLLTNTILYYAYMRPTFGYMAIILLLALPFVYPSHDRCLSETESE